MVRVAVIYTGTNIIVPVNEPSFQAVADSDTVYDFVTDDCGLIPDARLRANSPPEPGATESNVCWLIDSDDADSLVMSVRSYLGEPVWFSLQD